MMTGMKIAQHILECQRGSLNPDVPIWIILAPSLCQGTLSRHLGWQSLHPPSRFSFSDTCLGVGEDHVVFSRNHPQPNLVILSHLLTADTAENIQRVLSLPFTFPIPKIGFGKGSWAPEWPTICRKTSPTHPECDITKLMICNLWVGRLSSQK